MDNSEIKKELDIELTVFYQYLKEKYSPVPENYFLDVNCARKI